LWTGCLRLRLNVHRQQQHDREHGDTGARSEPGESSAVNWSHRRALLSGGGTPLHPGKGNFVATEFWPRLGGSLENASVYSDLQSK
jgi:hypothetical protein